MAPLTPYACVQNFSLWRKGRRPRDRADQQQQEHVLSIVHPTRAALLANLRHAFAIISCKHATELSTVRTGASGRSSEAQSPEPATNGVQASDPAADTSTQPHGSSSSARPTHLQHSSASNTTGTTTRAASGARARERSYVDLLSCSADELPACATLEEGILQAGAAPNMASCQAVLLPTDEWAHDVIVRTRRASGSVEADRALPQMRGFEV